MFLRGYKITGRKEDKILNSIAEHLLEKNIGVLRFDFNGHGKSEGDFQDMTPNNEMDDLKAIIHWLQKQHFTRTISLVGHSLGGIIVSMVATELGCSTIPIMVLLAPAGNLRDNVLTGNYFGIQFNPWKLPKQIEVFGGNIVGKKHLEEMRDLPIFETVKKYKGETLIVNGTHDITVPYTCALHFSETITSAELILIRDDDHLFTLTNDSTSLDVAQWIKEKLFLKQQTHTTTLDKKDKE